MDSGINPINVDTHRDLDHSLASAEITNLRGAWGASQWKVTQTGPQHAAASTELQSRISQPTLKLIQETSKLVSDVKLNETHLTIHPFSRHLKWNDLALVVRTDAAQGDRIDGGSTDGCMLTMAPYRQFIECHMTDMSLIGWSTNKLERVARSSLSAEIQQACITDDELFAASPLWGEINGYQLTTHNVADAAKATPGIIVMDAKGVYVAVQNSSSTGLGLTEKQSGIEDHDTDLRWRHSDIQPVGRRNRCRAESYLSCAVCDGHHKYVIEEASTEALGVRRRERRNGRTRGAR